MESNFSHFSVNILVYLILKVTASPDIKLTARHWLFEFHEISKGAQATMEAVANQAF